MAEIERPTHQTGYDNNHNFPEFEFNGIKFTDFSSYLQRGWNPLYKSISNFQTVPSFKIALNNKNLDSINHLISMILVNWNGAVIEKGNVDNGNTKIISSTPEFLEIIQKICIKVYDNLEAEKTLDKSKVTNDKLTGGSTTIKNINDLGSIVNTIANYVYLELEKNKTITKGTYSGTTLSGTDKTDVKNVADLCGLLGVLCTYIYANLENNKTITKGKLTNGKLAGSDITSVKNVSDLCSLLGVLCTYIYSELEAPKTITRGGYRDGGVNKTDVKDVSGVCGVLSDLCSDFYTYVYEPKTRSTGNVKAVQNSFIMSTPCGKDFSSDTAADKTALMPFTGIKDGEIYDVIFYNDSTADHTITIKNKAALTNLPSGCTIRVPDGEMIEADCPKGGYVEINYMRVGNTIWVRSA